MRFAFVAAGTVVAIASAGLSARSGKAPVDSSRADASPPGNRAAVGKEPLALPCGNLSCDPQRTYCETINTDVNALPSTYACRPLPAACRPRADGSRPGCDCFPEGTRCNFCSAPGASGTQGYHRTCFGGR